MVTFGAVVNVPCAGVRIVITAREPPQVEPIRNAAAKRDRVRCRSRDTGSSAGGVCACGTPAPVPGRAAIRGGGRRLVGPAHAETARPSSREGRRGGTIYTRT